MSNTHIVIPDQHAHPDHDNNRFALIGHLINDIASEGNKLKVINLGDGADMPSLSSYDKGTKGFEGKRYLRDIDSSLDAQDRLWSVVNQSVFDSTEAYYTIGNHEERITKATNHQAEYDGVIGIHDLQLEVWYDEVVPYNGGTPGIINVDGVNYAHYFVSGVMGRPVAGIHQAASLLGKQYASCTQGHSHTIDFAERTAVGGKKLMGLVAGCFVEHFHPWAGEANNLWWSGLVVKRQVEDGVYDHQFISLAALYEEYGDML
jgi:hypothetical protein